MKTIYLLMLGIFLSVTHSLAQTGQQNYVKTTTYLDEDATSAITSVQYYDGLGRPSVTATSGNGTNGNYTFSKDVYDLNGMETEKWLPAVGSSSPAYPTDFPNLSQITYNDSQAFTSTEYDVFGRITTVMRPGHNWRTADRVTSIEYGYNCINEINRYVISIQSGLMEMAGYYPSGTLTMERVIDEDMRLKEIYRDILGNIVMERRGSYPNNLDTYYVYNRYAQLCYVLQPSYQQDADLDAYAFQYAYNAKGLCSMKKIPGCEPVYYWYDSHNNKPAFMQDGNMRSEGRYRFMLYDRYGRLAVQGLCSLTNMPEWIDTQAYLSIPQEGIAHTGYVMNSGINLGNVTLEKAYYYDYYDYRFYIQRQPALDSLTAANTSRKPGLQTGEVTLGSDGNMLFTAIYYDEKGREIDRRRMMPDGDFLRGTTTYTFTDKPGTVVERFTRGGSSKSLEYTYSYYPSNDQPCNVTLSYNGSQPVNIAHYDYDGLGRVSCLTQGGNASVTNYTYHIQGGLKNILGNAFSQWLHYEDAPDDASYAGKIASMEWEYAGIQGGHEFSFTYDEVGRLTETYYFANHITGNPHYDEQVSYDDNGNILTMMRLGLRDNGQFGATDNLSYSYNGNQIVKVTDNVSGPNSSSTFHFIDNANNLVEYEYDPNGNITKDLNKKISLIEYNSLNLPTKIKMGYSYITYSYTSDGEKMKARYPTEIFWIVIRDLEPIGVNSINSFGPEVLPEIAPYDAIEYRGSFIYRNGSLEQALFDGGYITLDQQGSPHFHYYQHDHLGSVRAVVDETGSVERTNAYYPFGATFTKDASSDLQRYKFCGKELDRMYGINLLDFGARWYDPLLGRFTTIDPMCEDYYNTSPYAYCGGDPVNAVDPDGNSIYMLFYTLGNYRGDEMFRAAAETRKYDIENSESFDASKDIVILSPIQDLADLSQLVGNIVNAYSKHFGETSEFSIWSHAGMDGPTGTKHTSNNAIDDKQMSIEGWGNINFNWGQDATANFFGCKTGVRNAGSPSFATRVSSRLNFRGVTVHGQTSSAYPSVYSNIRQNTSNMLNGIFSYPTYMVGGDPLGIIGRFWPTYSPANPMRTSINGKGRVNNYYQLGRSYR